MDPFKAEIWRSFTKLTLVISSLVVTTSAFNCNFDTSMCDFVQDSNDNFDWKRHQRRTPSPATGPSADHTTGTGNGYYMYIETSYPRRTGDYAKLNSPELQFSGSMCLQFFYHMYGANMGRLTVNVNGNSVFNASGDKGDKWLRAAIDVNLSGKYAVTFEGTKGPGYQSDIAIDDFSLESGSCLMVCADPGTPLHGSRTSNSKDGGFSEGAIVSFQCNVNYELRGAKEIVCTKGKWSEKKLPLCVSQVDPNCKIDLVMVVGASGNVRDDWNTLLTFVADVVKNVNPGPNGSHIGMVQFGNDAKKIFGFEEFEENTYNEKALLEQITSINRPSSGERSSINRGLRLANREVLREESRMRPDVKQVTLLITDGGQTQITDPSEPGPAQVATDIRNRGISIVVLGIGSVDPIALWSYASSPDDVLRVWDFSQLSKLVTYTAKILCPTPTTTTPPTTTTALPTTTTAPPTATTVPPMTTTAPPTTTTAPPTTLSPKQDERGKGT